MDKTEKILVTGATGTIGSQVVRHLSSRGINSRVAIHSSSKAEMLKGMAVEICWLDYDKPKTMEAALQGIDKLFLLTPDLENQVSMAEQMIDLAKKAGVSHIVRSSAYGVDLEKDFTFARIHGQVEQYIRASGLVYTMLRPNVFMENFIKLYPAIDGKFYLPLGSGKVSYVAVQDIAAVAVEVLTQPGHAGKVYDLTGPEALSMYQITEMLTQALDKSFTYVEVSEDTIRKEMQVAGIPDGSIHALLEAFGIFKASLLSSVTNDIEKVTGRKATTFIQFAQENLHAFKTEIMLKSS